MQTANTVSQVILQRLLNVRVIKAILSRRKKELVAELLVRNNETYKDTRILFVINVLDTNAPVATLPKDARIKKLVLVNTLGFLHNMDPEAALETYKVVRVPELKNAIIIRH